MADWEQAATLLVSACTDPAALGPGLEGRAVPNVLDFHIEAIRQRIKDLTEGVFLPLPPASFGGSQAIYTDEVAEVAEVLV